MKTIALKIAFSIIFCAITLISFAQANRPFKGAWYSPEMNIEINFYEKNIPDPNTMDEDPCPGLIKMSPEFGGCTYSIPSVKITGNKAVCSNIYCAEGEATITLEYLPNGSLVLHPTNFTYVPKEAGIKKLSNPSYTLLKASPFAGTWKMKNKDAGTLLLSLYDKCIMGEDYEGNSGLCYGTITLMAGQRIDNCIVIDRKISGNEATIDFLGGRDGNTYRATIIYNPATKQISIKNKQLIKKGEYETEECYVTDGLIFYRQ